MIVYYDAETKRIIAVVDANSPNVEPPSNPGVPLYLDDTEYANVREDIPNYIIVDDVPQYSAAPPGETIPQPPTEQEQIDQLSKRQDDTENAVLAIMDMQLL